MMRRPIRRRSAAVWDAENRQFGIIISGRQRTWLYSCFKRCVLIRDTVESNVVWIEPVAGASEGECHTRGFQCSCCP